MRRVLWILCGVGLLAGCSESHPPKMSMEDMNKKPAPAPEMSKLNRFVGNWTGTADLMKPTAEQMKKMMPAGSEPPQTHFSGAESYQWTLDGQFLKVDGWHERGKGQRETFSGVTGWDAKGKTYWNGFISDWGGHGHGTMTADADGRTFRFTGEGCDAQGRTMTEKGTVRFVDDNTMDWSFQGNGPMGQIEMKGTMKRS